MRRRPGLVVVLSGSVFCTCRTLLSRCLLRAGMIAPTSGDAVINGLSIRDSMATIRQSLGVCPQFDILWPDISVAEHLQLYAAIKGFRHGDMGAVVQSAVDSVGARLEKLLLT